MTEVPDGRGTMVDHDQPTAAVDLWPLGSPRRFGRVRQIVILSTVLVLAVSGTALLASILILRPAPRTGPEVGLEVPATAMDMLSMPSNNSPMVVADPADSRFVVIANRVDSPSFGCALQVSGDGGGTWVGAVPVPTLPRGADTCYGPEVAFDANGALHYLFIGLRGPGNEPIGAYLTTSLDRGRTFSSPREILGPRNFGVRMAIDRSVGGQGRMHLVWLHAISDPPLGGFLAEANPIMAAHSDDGGITFSAPLQVSDPARARVVAPALTLGPDQLVHVGYYDLGGDARDYQGLPGPVWEGTWSVVVATSVDGGLQFGPGVVVDDQVAPPDRPILIFTMAPPALAADEDLTCAAWTDARHGDADVLLRCSRDEAASWGKARRVNDDALGNGYRQYLPRLSLAPGGRLDAVFLDRRHHPNNDRIDVSYTSSSDDGRSFAPNIRVTSKHSSALVGAQYEGPSAEGQFEIGSRLGLLSTWSEALLAWPDSRHSLLPGTAQDIFAAEVTHSTSHQPFWAKALGAVLLGSAILAVAVAVFRRWPMGTPAPSVDEDRVSAEKITRVHAGPRRGRLVRVPLIAAVGGMGVVTVMVISTDRGTALPRPQVVDVAMTENYYEYLPPAHGGRVVFRARNAGSEEHRIAIYPLPEDMPPIDVQLRGSDRRTVERLAAPLPLRPGETQSFAVDLEPSQRYALLCLLKKPDQQKTYAELGMNSEFRTAD